MGDKNEGIQPYVGFTAGAFDLLHPGHLMMLQEAKDVCDYLIVALHTNPAIERPNTKKPPVETVAERWIRLSSCKFVDCIIPYDTEEDLCLLLESLKPNVRIIGADYKDRDFTGKKLCEILGIQIHYNTRFHPLSSTLYREKI